MLHLINQDNLKQQIGISPNVVINYEIMKAIKSFYSVGNEFYDYMLKKEV